MKNSNVVAHGTVLGILLVLDTTMKLITVNTHQSSTNLIRVAHMEAIYLHQIILLTFYFCLHCWVMATYTLSNSFSSVSIQ